MIESVALVTSGLGTPYGGIGVVAEAIADAVRPGAEVRIWKHPAFWPRPLRVARVSGHMWLSSRRPPDLIIYDHLHLAVLHSTVARLREIPYVVFLHGVEAWQELKGRRQEALLGATGLIANSATTVVLTRAANPWLPKVEVVWLGVRMDSKPPIAAGEFPPRCLIVGRMATPERYKGHDAVLDAWPLIRAAVPQATLSIIGEGDDRARLQRRVGNENLQGIEFRGRVSDHARDQAYRSSRLLFYPSQQEGFGLAGVEAAGHGLPFVGLAGTVAEELFPAGAGMVPAKDLSAESIAQATIPLLTHNQLATQTGRAGWERVHSIFLEKHFAERFRKTIDKVTTTSGQTTSSDRVSATA